MKPPIKCSHECAEWFRLTAQFQKRTMTMIRSYPHHGFKDELKIRFRTRQSMLRTPSF